jgi:2-methylcitrate dehydratase
VLVKKFESSVAGHFGPKQSELIHATFADARKLDAMPVNELMAVLVKN